MKKIISIVLIIIMVTCNSYIAFGATSAKDRTAKSDDGGSTWTYYNGETNVDPEGDGKESDGTPSNGQNVTASYDQDSVNNAQVLSVDISWGDLNYKYSATGAWDPSSHNYGDGIWTPVNVSGGDEIQVTNHSNTSIKAEFEFTQNEAAGLQSLNNLFNSRAVTTGCSFNPDYECFYLSSAVGTTTATAPSGTVGLVLSNNPGKVFSNGATIGTVTVNLSVDGGNG